MDGLFFWSVPFSFDQKKKIRISSNGLKEIKKDFEERWGIFIAARFHISP